VRAPVEAKEGKIPGAKVINLMGSDFQAQINKLPKDKAYFVYCRSGARSARACGIMSSAGFSQVTNLQGGIMNWMRAGKKVK
jgi:phage shock protein E